MDNAFMGLKKNGSFAKMCQIAMILLEQATYTVDAKVDLETY